MRRATLKDVAHAAGLSLSTAAFVLRGDVERFPQDTRDRVLAAARRIGYRANASARATRSGRMGAIGLVQVDEHLRGDLAWSTLAGALGAVEGGGDHLLVTRIAAAVLGDASRLPKLLAQLVVDGVLLSFHTAVPAALPRAIRDLRVPAVWLNARLAHDSVHLDDRAAGAEAVRRLAALGHRRIAFVNPWHGARPERHYSMDDRLRGYRDAMARGGLAPQAVLERFDPAALLAGEDRPTALVLYDAAFAADVLVACARRGLAVPDDVSLATFRDGDAIVAGVPLAGMRGGYRAMGERAVELLRAAIDDPRAERPSIAVPATWEPGASIAPPRGRA